MRSRPFHPLAFAALFCAFALTSALAVAPVARAATSGCTNWAGTLPVQPGLVNQVSGVATVSRCSAWLVGETRIGNWTPLAEHWNGSSWTQVTVPYAGGAVGDITGSGGNDRNLIERWNGKSWRKVGSPNPGGPGNPNDMTAISARSGSVWAVGDYGTAMMALHCC